MKGEPIEAVNVGLQSLLSALRQNPYALESVYLSISTFDTQIKMYSHSPPLKMWFCQQLLAQTVELPF